MAEREAPPLYLCVYQLGIHYLSCAVADVVHTAYPFHLVVCFELFGDSFGFGELTSGRTFSLPLTFFA